MPYYSVDKDASFDGSGTSLREKMTKLQAKQKKSQNKIIVLVRAIVTYVIIRQCFPLNNRWAPINS